MLRRGHFIKPKEHAPPAAGAPKQYPWDDSMTVAKARSFMKHANQLTEDDHNNLMEHVERLHPQVLTSRRRF